MSNKVVKIYTNEEYKQIYSIVYEYYKLYNKKPLEEAISFWKERMKQENDFSSITYKACKDLLEEEHNSKKKIKKTVHVKVNTELLKK